MSLTGILIEKVGPAVANAIAARWLGDSGLGKTVTTEVIDFLAAKAGDAFTARKARRQFEIIGENVAKNLLGVFELEGMTFDEPTKAAICLAVAGTMQKATLEAGWLVERNLDPRRLANELIASDPVAARDFSPSERQLYERVIEEASQLIVDIASQLPAFNERALGEILRREEQILKVVEQVFEDVRRIRQTTAKHDPQTEATRFEADYRRAVLRTLDRVELFGLDASSASRRHQLSVAYVTLSADQPGPDRDARHSSPPARPDSPVESDRESGDFEESDREATVTVDQLLAGSSRLAVLGHAGSGKTTLLQWIAVRSASKTFEGALESWNDTIPFFIRLRECREGAFPSPEQFPRLVAPSIADTMPHGWVHERLKRGTALVLVDGIDEVLSSRRGLLLQWMRDLAGSYPKARVIVTSRPHAADEEALKKEGFSAAELQPMSLKDIFELIDHWHRAVSDELTDEEERGRMPKLAEKLKQQVKDSRPLHSLATTPLLCAMLCALHSDRRAHLPSDRIELYEAGCHMLLERRDVERGIDMREYPALSYREKQALVGDLAYWLINNGWSAAERDAVDQRLGRTLGHLNLVNRTFKGTDVRRLLVERSGMLREATPGKIDFAHRTFQEYLAAKACLDEGNVGVLVKNAHDDQWREVIILAAGLASADRREKLIRGLIERGDEEQSSKRHTIHLIAVACLETSVSLSSELQGELKKRLRRLVPPTNIAEARALASAGDLAVPYLNPRVNSNVAALGTVAAACVRALALIGTSQALAAMEDYTKDGRLSVKRELFRAWESFDDEEDYVHRILSKMKHTDDSIRLWVDCPPLTQIPSLNHLALSSNGVTPNLPRLRHLPALKTLEISYFYADLNIALMALPKTLERVFLKSCRGRVSPASLVSLPNLHTLVLESVNYVNDPSVLGKLTALSELEIDESDYIQDLSWISNLKQLTRLSLSRCTRLQDIGPLAQNVNLQQLSLSGSAKIRDLSPVRSLKDLRVIDISGLDAVSLEPLTELSKLEHVVVSHPGALRRFPEALRGKVATRNFAFGSSYQDRLPLDEV